MLAAYAASVLALVLLTVLPGPDVAVVTRFALSGGRRAAVRAALGIVAGLGVWGCLTVAGLAAVLAASATAYTVVTIAGAVFLVALGLRVLWSSRRRPPAGAAAPTAPAAGRPLRTGLLTNLLNPKIAVFYTGLLPSLVPAGGSPRVWLPVLVATHAVLSVVWLTAYASALTRSRAVLGRPRVRLLLDRLTGCVLVALGLRVAAGIR